MSAVFSLQWLYRNPLSHIVGNLGCVPPSEMRSHSSCTLHSMVQSWPKISAPLVNMIKEGCENESLLLILLIFYLRNSQNSNLSLDHNNLKWGEISLWNKCCSLIHIGHNQRHLYSILFETFYVDWKFLIIGGIGGWWKWDFSLFFS